MADRMSYFNSRALFSGICISYIFRLTGTSFWISYIIGIILGVIVLLLIKKVNNCKLVKSFTGFIFALLSGSVLVNMGHTLYLKETPVIFLTVLPLIAAFIISNSKKDALIKCVFIFFVYSILLFFLKILGLYGHINIENLYPVFTSSVKDILIGALVVMLVSVVPVLSLNDISDKKNIIINYLVSMTTILFVSFFAISVLGLKEVELYRYPEYIVLKRIEFLNFINNVDSFFNFAIIVDLIFTMGAGLKNIEIGGKLVKIISVILLFILINYICYRCSLLLYIYSFLPLIMIIIFVIILIPNKS